MSKRKNKLKENEIESTEVKQKLTSKDSEENDIEVKNNKKEDIASEVNSTLNRQNLKDEEIRLHKEQEEWARTLKLLKQQKQELEDEIIAKKARLEDECKGLEKKLADAYKGIAEKKVEAMATFKETLDEEYSKFEEQQEVEREILRARIEREFSQKEEQLRLREERLNSEQEFFRRKEDELNDKIQSYNHNLKILNNERCDFENEKNTFLEKNSDIELARRRLEHRKNNLDRDEANFSKIVEEQASALAGGLQNQLEITKQELIKARAQLSELIEKQDSAEHFKSMYGDEPDRLQRKITSLQEENAQLLDKIDNMVDIEKYSILETERNGLIENLRVLEEQNANMSVAIATTQSLKSEKAQLEQALANSQKTIDGNNKWIEYIEKKLERYEASKMITGARESRIAAIKQGILGKHVKTKEDNKVDPNVVDNKGMEISKKTSQKPIDQYDSMYFPEITEIQWLNGIIDECEKFGVYFNKRIIYAFHTALKIQDWSIITVLSGVSGTGKSELPKLYAAFGGFNFCAVPVQPNWDSQESMLGYFNSIDNKFEPEDVLRFLAQCTEPGTLYSNYMSIVLLDEMNLAHVEYYFAEFLSKLETRRTQQNDDLPSVSVKLGAGIEPYHLPMRRNVVWVGTMNQDETTKSLSDKVLDRGVIINFPRPTELVGRKEMPTLIEAVNAMEKRPKMHVRTFQSWVCRTLDNIPEAQRKILDNYKKVVEDINEQLDGVGRALGHRVWQSIEFYIVNYPTVRELMNRSNISEDEADMDLEKEMHIAFEDQIVQKIMPKLRGIDTRDKKGRHSLANIEKILIDNKFTSLQKDFTIAREQGYGQFMWNSAKYLSYSEDVVYDINEEGLEE